MKVLCEKDSFGGLRPCNSIGKEVFSRIKQGDSRWVEITEPRNVRHHKLYWALIDKVHENLDERRAELYSTTKVLHAALKISAGVYTPFKMPNGEMGLIPGSIKFAQMDQPEFDIFFDKVCDLIHLHFLEGVTSEELKQEIYRMTGIT